MHHRNAILPPPPPARDTVPCDAPDDGEPAESGVHVIDPDRAALMRAEWTALWATEPAPVAALDTETSAWGAYPGSLS